MFKYFKNANYVHKAAALVAVAVIALSLWSIWQGGKDEYINAPSVASERAITSGNNSIKRYYPYKAKTIHGEQDLAWQLFYKLQQKEEARQHAAAAEAARQYIRSVVSPDRSNIDCTSMRCIALTYDDGPDRSLTPKLLDILHERDAVATFFVVGNRVASRETTIKRIVDEKNEVGNHTWTHANLELLSAEQIDEQVNSTNDAIFNITGKRPHFMRPPYAKYSASVASKVNMPMALWNIDPKDWRDRDANVIYERVIGAARSGGVVVMHDILASSIEATPRIIDELQRQGYVLVTLSELFGVTDENVGSLHGQVLRGR